MMKKLGKIALWTVGVLIVLAIGIYPFLRSQMPHHTVSGTPAAIEPSGDRVLDSIRRGVEYLKVHQEPDGEFSAGLLDPKPAFTALVVDTLARCPDRYDSKTPWVKKALDAIVSHQQPDGGLYTPRLGMGNYCTSVAIMALEGTKDPAYAPVIRKASDYLRGLQHSSGGTSYNAGGRPDMSNTMMTLEALKAAGLDESSEEFKRAAAFVSLCQNNSETNSSEYAAVVNDGGGIYRPGESKAGEVVGRDGRVGFKSYGLMSYAVLVSFLWIGVHRDDARVKSAFKWVQNNWTLEENRNLGNSGLYYYYLTMAKALRTYGQREITTADGKVHDWPVELADKIISLQKPDGSWRNENNQWFESDSVLVTAYMVRTLTICREVIGAEDVKRGK
ncbi:MAG: prenyltransferase/squalene oxidase repeat-containing protein [Planctomycetota bacterium]|jgi:squalene-hopene/tetraprenyl-beta-curcumene cyclase